MTIRHLKMFAAVCEYGGVTRAAEALHVAQPVVSTAVSELEKYYGIRLFERINQRLVITEQGGELLVKARDVISCFEDFEGLAREDSGKPRVRVGSSLTIAQTGLPAIIKKIRERYPAVDLCIEANKTSEIEEGIMRGELDFGIVEDRVMIFCNTKDMTARLCDLRPPCCRMLARLSPARCHRHRRTCRAAAAAARDRKRIARFS